MNCRKVFNDWNLTKAVHHVAQQNSNDIAKCKTLLGEEDNRIYQSIYHQYKEKAECRKRKQSVLNTVQDENINKALFHQKSNKKSQNSIQSLSDKFISNSIASNEKQLQLTKTNNRSLITTEIDDEKFLSNSSVSKGKKQLYPVFAVGARENDEKARMAIADFIIGCGLPFSIADHPKFRYMCKFMRNSSNKFNFPNRNMVSSVLMDALYESNRKKYIQDLSKNAEIFGLTFLGDGATVKRMPLINIIASGVYCPVAVLAISDCTSHMADGNIKDANYISNDLFLPHFKKIDPHKKFIDLVAFDGAANVQKAGRILCTHYPKCTAIHGGEHVVSLVCGDICKLPVISELIKINKLFYKFFMIHHMSHSMLLYESKKHNAGKSIMFIKAADTRMGGHIISLARTYRLKSTLESLVTNSEFLGNIIGKRGVKQKIISLVQSKSFWNHVLVCLKCMHPLLKLLRLCDKKEPAMDRLFFYVRKADLSLENAKECLNKMQKEFDARDPKMKNEYYHVSVMKDDIDVENEFDVEYEDSSDESDDETDIIDSSKSRKSDNREDLGSLVLQHWKKRRPHLIHSYTIAAWMLSPIPEVMEDAKSYTDDHHNIVDELIEKLFGDDDEFIEKLFGYDEKYGVDKLKDLFWQEYKDFSIKVGAFSKSYIWTSSLIQSGKSFEWHSLYSLRFTKILGRLACRVTSKIIGIGSAERNWGDVKHLKSGKRSHMLGKKLEKQATIYGTSCVEYAKIRRDFKSYVNEYKENLFFDDDDLAKILKISPQVLNDACPKEKRTFKAWVESWEKSTLENCPKLAKKLLKKYGGLKFIDPDNNDAVMTVNPEHCCYKDGSEDYKGEYGLILYAMEEGMEVDDVKEQEPWELPLTIEQIVEYGDSSIEIITNKTLDVTSEKAVENDKEVIVKKEKDSSTSRKKLKSNDC